MGQEVVVEHTQDTCDTVDHIGRDLWVCEDTQTDRQKNTHTDHISRNVKCGRAMQTDTVRNLCTDKQTDHRYLTPISMYRETDRQTDRHTTSDL